jgi:hypothetical protein
MSDPLVRMLAALPSATRMRHAPIVCGHAAARRWRDNGAAHTPPWSKPFWRTVGGKRWRDLSDRGDAKRARRIRDPVKIRDP